MQDSNSDTHQKINLEDIKRLKVSKNILYFDGREVLTADRRDEIPAPEGHDRLDASDIFKFTTRDGQLFYKGKKISTTRPWLAPHWALFLQAIFVFVLVINLIITGINFMQDNGESAAHSTKIEDPGS